MSRGRHARRLAATIFLTSVVALQTGGAQARDCRHHCRVGPRWPYPYGLDLGPPIYPGPPPPEGLAPESHPEEEPPVSPEPSLRLGPAPYPQGFVLDVPIAPDRDTAGDLKADPTLTRYRDVAAALARCWDPPGLLDGKPWRQLTLRVSFKRDGTINGRPLIPFVGGDLTPDARSDLTTSLTAALQSCAPLKFSPSLGAAIAGQIFALRFIEQDQTRWPTLPKP